MQLENDRLTLLITLLCCEILVSLGLVLVTLSWEWGCGLQEQFLTAVQDQRVHIGKLGGAPPPPPTHQASEA